MSLATKLNDDSWDRDEGAERVEHIAAYNPELADRIGMIALRFIQEKGLSDEFASLLEEIDRADMTPADPSGPM